MDQRDSHRFFLDGGIAFHIEGRPGEGTLINLSTSGCAVRCGTAVRKGEYLELRVYLTEAAPPVKVDLAAVRWSHGMECGVEFIRITSDMQKQLRHLLESEDTPVPIAPLTR